MCVKPGRPTPRSCLWDGVRFSGPHSSKCMSTVLRRDGSEYEVSTSCSALGDGSPDPVGTPSVESFVLTWLSRTRFGIAKEKQPRSTYRWCSPSSRTSSPSHLLRVRRTHSYEELCDARRMIRSPTQFRLHSIQISGRASSALSRVEPILAELSPHRRRQNRGAMPLGQDASK